MRRLAAIILLIMMIVGAAGRVPAQTNQPVAAEQDGIAASLSLQEGLAVVRWRFIKQLQMPLSGITATFNNRPLGTPNVEAYPASDTRTAILLLLDLSDPGREAQIQQNKIALIEITGHAESHQQIAWAVYADSFELLVSDDRNVETLVNRVANAQPIAALVKLGQVLNDAVELLAQTTADRRGIYVLSDGHSDDVLHVAGVSDLAKRGGVALNFFLSPSERAVDLPALKMIAAATGGEVIDQAKSESFLNNPFALLESGAIARFPLGNARRYFWEPEADIKVVFHYGDRSLELSSPAPPIPLAGPVETSKYLADTHPIVVSGVGGIIVAFCVAGATLVKRRKAVMPVKPELTATMLRTQEAPQPAVDSGSDKVPLEPLTTAEPRSPQPPTMLEDVENGTTYEIGKPLVQIGRDAANDVVLQDMTVSRFHAVLRRGADGAYSIENQSDTNATRINYRKVGAARLADGDVIEFGATKLRYRQPARFQAE